MPLTDEEEINLRVTAFRLAADTYGIFALPPGDVYDFLTAGLPNAPVRSLPNTGHKQPVLPFLIKTTDPHLQIERSDVSGVDDDPSLA